MKIYRITLRRLRRAHAIPVCLVHLSVKTRESASEVVARYERTWREFDVVGIERAA